MHPDYPEEVCAAHAEIQRAILLLEGASLEDVLQAQEAIAEATALAIRAPGFTAWIEDGAFSRDLRLLNGLVQNALYFYRGWQRVAALAPAAYTATGGPPPPAAAASLCVEG